MSTSADNEPAPPDNAIDVSVAGTKLGAMDSSVAPGVADDSTVIWRTPAASVWYGATPPKARLVTTAVPSTSTLSGAATAVPFTTLNCASRLFTIAPVAPDARISALTSLLLPRP